MVKKKYARKRTTKKSVAKKRSAKKSNKWVAVSGGFDPVHIGHVRMFEAAKKFGEKVIAILNNDNWLRSKKGFVFMPQKERIEVLSAFRSIDKVILTEHKPNDSDRSVCRELEKIKPSVFANGGDKKNMNDIPETSVCKKYGIRMIFNAGKGGKVQSSSWLTADMKKNLKKKRGKKKRSKRKPPHQLSRRATRKAAV